jgi:hypothetical protein
MTRPRTAVLLTVVATLGASGCEQPRACTEIGASNGVNVSAPGLARPGQLEVEVCVVGQCATGPLFADGPAEAFVELAAVDSVETRTYRVTVRGADGAVVVPAQEHTVGARRVQPNGEGCPPVAHQASVSLRT